MSTNTTFSIKGKTNRLFITLASLMSVFVLTFIFTFIASSVLAPVNVTDAESVTINIADTNYYVTTTANDINLSLNATPTGTLAVGKDTVNTKTNCDGYQLYVSTASSENRSIMNPNTHTVDSVSANALFLEGSDETAGDWIPATAGSFTAAAGGPQAFKDNTYNNTNTWGFAVPSGSVGLPATAGAFDATYTTTEEGANLENKFAAVPILDSPVLVQETNSADETGVNLDIYYGIYANSGKSSGNYTNDVLYSVVAEAPSSAASVYPSTITNMNGTSSITVITPIGTSMELEPTDATVTVGGVSCPVTNVLTKDSDGMPGTLRIVCTAPSLTALGGNLGSYNVVVNITKFAQSYTITNGVTYSLGSSLISTVSPTTFNYEDQGDITINTEITATGLTASDIQVYLVDADSTATLCPLSTNNPITYVNNKLVLNCTKPSVLGGVYDVRVNIIGQAITKEDAITVSGGPTPGPTDLPEFYTITTMQEMTPEVCDSVYTPGAYTSYTGEAPNIITKKYAEHGLYEATADGQNFIPETTLIDYRGLDGTGTAANPVTEGSNVKTYKVRKLADGNCWMSEELYLPLAVGTGIEASYNDGTTFTYTPTATAINGNTKTYTWNNTERWYYNWYAATAEQNNNAGANVDVDGSICPKGWKLPSNYTVTGKNPATSTDWSAMSWSALMAGYGYPTTNVSGDYTAQLQASPLSLIRAGYYANGSFYDGGASGYYWSSTAASSSYAYRLRFDTSYLYPQANNTKSANGFTIRCVAVR